MDHAVPRDGRRVVTDLAGVSDSRWRAAEMPMAPTGWRLLQPWWPRAAAWRWQWISTGSTLLSRLAPDEQVGVAQAAPKRQWEFAAGRWCAHAALHELGAATRSIPVAAHRAPVWPPDIVGTITHDDLWAGSLAAHREDWSGLGLDIDRIDRFRPELQPLICTPLEFSRHLSGRDIQDSHTALASIFSIKEAAFKALNADACHGMEFQDAEVIELPTGRVGAFRLRLRKAVGAFPCGHLLTGHVAHAEGRVVSLIGLVGRP